LLQTVGPGLFIQAMGDC